MVARRGASALGCLFTAIVLAVVLYASFHVGTAYVERYRFEEQMRQEIHFAARRTDDDIKARLKTWADSSGYPPDAGRRIGISRTAEDLRIWSDYEPELRLPLVKWKLKFHPSAEGPL